MDWKSGPLSHPKLFLRDSSGLKVELAPNRVYLFGRGEFCDFPLDDIAASRRHARLSVAGDVRVVHAEDLGSKNGTFVNNEVLDARRQLRSGDRLRIGKAEYTVEIQDSEIDIQLDTRTMNVPKEETASDPKEPRKRKKP